MSSTLVDHARKFAEKALELDKQKRYNEAQNYYLDAADALLKAVRFERNPESAKALRRKASLYVSRAKELQRAVQEQREHRGRKETGDSDDDEQSELEKALSDTIITEKPDVSLDDVAGLAEAKQALREAIVLPLARPDLFTGARKPWKGILMFGPPGTGKTLLAKAAATEVDATFFNVSSASIMSKWLGQSEKLVKMLFELAREKQPSIVFIDEVDSLTQQRGGEHEAARRVKTQLLTSMDGVGGSGKDRVVVIGATNVPWEIDAAFRRRFERRIKVPLPDHEARTEIFKLSTKGVELDDDVDFEVLAIRSEGYSGADIALISREAIMMPIREMDSTGAITNPDLKPRPVRMQDFLTALNNISPSVSPSELVKYEEWEAEFGSG